MNLEELLKDKKIQKFVHKQKPDFSRAEEDISTAKSNLSAGSFVWALNIAYNAVLISAMELMYSFGYRPIGKEHHKNSFEFLREINLNQDLVEYFDGIRKKRNKNTYGEREEISKSVAKEVIKKAEEFVQEIRTFVQENRTN